MDRYLIIKIKDVKADDVVSATVSINSKNTYEISAFGKRLPKKEDFMSFYNSEFFSDEDNEVLQKISFLEGNK